MVEQKLVEVLRRRPAPTGNEDSQEQFGETLRVKRCPHCETYKNETDFRVVTRNADGLSTQCGDCLREKERQRRKRYAQQNQELVDAARQCGCYICGERDASVLQFHHFYEIGRGGNQRKSKKNAQRYSRISTLKLNKSPLRMQRELAKCYVLCANDHLRVHSGAIVLPPPVASDAPIPATTPLPANGPTVLLAERKGEHVHVN